MIKEDIFRDRLENITASYPKLIDLSLKRILNLLEKLGNPHLNLPPVIHVAGTNGKGSTIAFMNSILKKSNKVVHVYTSPHLISIRERIIISNNYVSIDCLSKSLEYCSKINGKNPITQFEMLTVLAFYLMSKNTADIAIIETGLGGRLDATNIILKPLITIITSISYDHMEFLGNTLELIAKEKAGIMKKNVLCVSAPQNQNVEKVLTKESKRLESKLLLSDKDWFFSKFSDKISINYLNKKISIPKPSLNGAHQITNASLACMALMCCKGLKLSLKDYKDGILNASWPGRLEQINNGDIRRLLDVSSELWIDGGHNVLGATVILEWLQNYKIIKNFKSVILIFGLSKNKEAKKILSILKGEIDKTIFVPIENSRNLYSSKDLQIISSSLSMKSSKSESLSAALKSIQDIKDSLIIIFGSLYLVGDFKKINKD